MPWRSRILAELEATARRAALKRARVHVGREHGAAGAPFPSDRIVIPSHASWNLASNLAHHNLPDARGSFATGDAVSHGVLRPAGPQKWKNPPGSNDLSKISRGAGQSAAGVRVPGPAASAACRMNRVAVGRSAETNAVHSAAWVGLAPRSLLGEKLRMER